MSQIEAGKWLNLHSYIADSFGGHPKICTKVSKTRVYYKRWFEDKERTAEASEEFCNIDSVCFVCDTLEEIQAISKLGLEQVEAISDARKVVKDDYTKRLIALRKKFKGELPWKPQ